MQALQDVPQGIAEPRAPRDSHLGIAQAGKALTAAPQVHGLPRAPGDEPELVDKHGLLVRLQRNQGAGG